MITPIQFFRAIKGKQKDRIEAWRMARFTSWCAIIAQRGAKEMPSPKDLLSLPGDDEQEQDVRREDFDEIFKRVQQSWDLTPH